MLSIFKNLFKSNSVDLTEWINSGATIVDVRTDGEFKSGHVKGSINIPLDQIKSNAGKLKNYSKIVVCCQSGMRSGQAKGILEGLGFTNVANGGGWQNVNRYKR